MEFTEDILSFISETWYVHDQYGYLFGTELLNKQTAEGRCRDRKIHLASIHSADENIFLKNTSRDLG